MLSVKQNFVETVTGGKPDRFVKQYEPFKLFFPPFMYSGQSPACGGEPVVNSWGVTLSWPEGTPGPFPVHTEDKIVIKDITRWREYVRAPRAKSTPQEWGPVLKAAGQVDRQRYIVTACVAPGIFEQCHYLGEIQNTLMNFYLEPDSLKELIEYITEWELELAADICENLKPEALLHHDDWGSQKSTFISPEMFAEFIVPAYKRVYGYYKSHGVKYIIHHSDSYAETLVPYMIEMGIDVWQGALQSNDIPGIIEKYGGKISVMGGIDCALVDYDGVTEERIRAVTEDICRRCGRHYFIPCTTQGGPGSIYPGVYEMVDEEIEHASRLLF